MSPSPESEAGSVPIQVIGAPGFSTIPTSCTSTGPSEDTLDTLGANGVLGIGLFRQDCGPACAVGGASNPGLYFACSPSVCQPFAQGLTQQLQNPVWLFSQDNNGVIVELPTISPMGAATVSGSLVFGIGTQSNNAPGSAALFTVDGQGTFTTIYQGQSYGGSFLDTGSNAVYFLDSRTSGLALCPDTADFYCPTSPQSLTATHRGVNGTTANVTFGVAKNADTLLGNLSFLCVQPAGRTESRQLRLGFALLLWTECVYGDRIAEHAARLRAVLGLLTGCRTAGNPD